MMELQPFFYNGGDEVEDINQYKPGGYHPVLLGDVLPKESTRYRVLQKLGHGSFATVWLAKDLQGELGYVALKINISRITGNNNEARILEWLESAPENHPGRRNNIRLFDHFIIEGPNGKHECLVVELVGCVNDFLYIAGFQSCIKELSAQIMAGLAYLHSRGIAHADLHSGNLGISLPQLQEHSEEALMDHFEDIQCTPVIPRKVEEGSVSLPAYIVSRMPIKDYLILTKTTLASIKEPCLKIMDFGNSFRIEDSRPPSNTPLCIRAPEVTFYELSEGKICSDWNESIDIWAAACTLYELNFGNELLWLVGEGHDLIHATAKLAGPPPPDWLPYWNAEQFANDDKRPLAFDPDSYWADRRVGLEKRMTSDSTRKDLDELIDMLRKMLRMDPKERPRMEELLTHPWLAGLAGHSDKDQEAPVAPTDEE